MRMRTVNLPDDLKRLAESRAEEVGCANVEEYVARLIQGEAAGAPEGLQIESDEGMEALMRERMEGPWVEMDAADFTQMREKLAARLDGRDEGRQP